MVAALRTGLGKNPGSRLIALGTRPADESHWFAKMLAGGCEYSQVHAAREADRPFWKRTIRRANPSYDILPSLRARIAKEIEDAKLDPDAMASFEALRLNKGQDDTVRSVLLDADSWKRAQALGPAPRRSFEYVLGLDLGQNEAMSGAAAYFRDGTLEVVAVLPQIPNLREKGLADGVGALYQQMERRGELIRAGRRVSDISSLLAESLKRWGKPAALVVDRWRAAELRDALERSGFPRASLVVRGQGFKDGGADVRAFRRAVLGGLVRPVESLLLTSALREARVVTDQAGNAKLAKSSEGGRRQKAKDDAAAAAILAVSAGFRQWHERGGVRRRRRSVVL